MQSVGIEQRKREARAHFRAVRKAIPPAARGKIDGAIQRNIARLPEFQRADVVLTYLSFGAEVETRGLIRAAWDAGKVVALPWCVPNTRELRWFRITSFDDLVRSSFGMEEPRPDPANEQQLNTGAHMLAMVPGLTFDAAGYRLGYGGGFYDTFLSAFLGASVGLCREAQLVPDLCGLGIVDTNDLPVDAVVTENGIFSQGDNSKRPPR